MTIRKIENKFINFKRIEMAKYNLIPVDVPKVGTKYRKIKTKLPVPESLSIFHVTTQDIFFFKNCVK